MCSSYRDLSAHSGGFAGLVLPLSRMSCKTEMPSLIGMSWEEVYSFVDRESLSWAKLGLPCRDLNFRKPCPLLWASFVNRIATKYASRLLQLHIYFYLALHISLNSLDREGARLLSPCGSQITITPSGSSTRTLNDTMFPFLMISSGAQLGVIGTVSHVGLFFYFGAVVGP